jgi:hypothetical protein
MKINKLPEKISIRLHSFADLITNSSTSIYVAASESTIKSVKEIVNSVLKIGGSTLTADDLFTFELSKDEDGSNEYYDQVDLIVKPKDITSVEGKTVAKILSNLTGLFNIDGYRNG